MFITHIQSLNELTRHWKKPTHCESTLSGLSCCGAMHTPNLND
jgi:hypothetical protein